MLDTFKHRLAVVIILIVILISLFVWYGSLQPDPDVHRYPGDEHLIKNRHEYVGDEVEVGGKVVSTSPLMIEIEYGDESRELYITGVDEELNKNDRVTVFGTLEDENTIAASEIIAKPYINYVYMYAVSVVAATWILFRIRGQFRWDKENWIFIKREDQDG